MLAFDSTTFSTYSENQSEARRGFNKDGDGLNTIKLLTLYSVKAREPMAFTKQPGNIPDVITIENTLTQLKCLNLNKPLIVTDNGYYSQKNMMEFALRNMKFLTLVDPKIVWVRETVDALRATLSGMSSTCQFDPSICGATSLRMHQFNRVRQRARNGKVAGVKETITRRLYVHVYYSPDNEAKKELAFRKDLLELKAQIEGGKTEFTKAAQNKIDKYLTCSRKGRRGQLKVGFDEKTITEEQRSTSAISPSSAIRLWTHLPHLKTIGCEKKSKNSLPCKREGSTVLDRAHGTRTICVEDNSHNLSLWAIIVS